MLIEHKFRISAASALMGMACTLPIITGAVCPLAGQATPAAQTNKSSYPAYIATMWKTRTVVLPNGTHNVQTQRIRVEQSAAGVKSKEMYVPTKGPNHDTSAPLQRSLQFAPATSSGTPLDGVVLSRIEKAEARSASGTAGSGSHTEVTDLGSDSVAGIEANGKRYVTKLADGSIERTLERWYAPSLNLVVRLVDTRPDGNSTATEMTELSR